MKVSEYNIVVAHSSMQLTEKVSLMIGRGWQPIGGAFKTGTGNEYIGQAIIKYANTDINLELKTIPN